MYLLLGLYGIPLVLIVFGLQIYTAILLGRSWIIATTLDPQISQKNRYFYYLFLSIKFFNVGPIRMKILNFDIKIAAILSPP